MFNSEILEVAIGLIFVFLVASLLASALREMAEAVLKTRAIQLERGIRQLLDDPDGTGTTKALFSHPLLYGLFAGGYSPETQLKPFVLPWAKKKHAMGEPPGKHAGKRLHVGSNMPAYVPSRNFALALMHEVGVDGPGVLTLESLRANAMAMPPGRIRDAVLAAVSEAGDSLDRARTSLEAWYDSNMDRVSGWYKRETQYVLFGLGVVIAIALNINVFSVANELASNNSLRLATVIQAQDTRKELEAARPTPPAVIPPGTAAPPKPDDSLKLTPEKLDAKLQGLSSLIGWNRFADEMADQRKKNGPFWALGFVVWVVGGWLLTAVAVSLGAPFWFDLLNKFMIIRSTVKPYEKSPSEGSEDRRGAKTSAEKLAPTPSAAGTGVAVSLEGDPMRRLAKVNLRLAVETAGLVDGSLELLVDGEAVAVPPDGFVELPLSVDVPHKLEAKAKRGAKVARWSQVVAPHLNSEGEPLDAVLT